MIWSFENHHSFQLTCYLFYSFSLHHLLSLIPNTTRINIYCNVFIYATRMTLYNLLTFDMDVLSLLFSYILKLPRGNDLGSAPVFPVVTSERNLTGISRVQYWVYNLQVAARGEVLQSVSRARKWHCGKILGLNIFQQFHFNMSTGKTKPGKILHLLQHFSNKKLLPFTHISLIDFL